MSIQPQWLTPAGDLGTIPEGVLYQVPVQAVANGQPVRYSVVAGELPVGIQIKSDGLLEGVAKNTITIQGVPVEVSENVVSKFTVRAFTTKTINGKDVIDRLNDRTFSITVSGQDAPEFITPPGQIASFFDGAKASVQVLFKDRDPGDTVTVRLSSGELPPGLSLDPVTGVISGIVEPLIPVSGFDTLFIAGPDGRRDNERTDIFNFTSGSFDFPGETFDQGTPGFSASGKNFQFTLEITDGKSFSTRSFGIFVFSVANLNAATATITVDNTFITADNSTIRLPVLVQNSGLIAQVRSDNYFAFKFDGVDFEGQSFTYELVDDGDLSLPPGLSLDSETGWLSGYIPDQGAIDQIFNFGIRLRKVNLPNLVTATEFFSINLIESIDGVVKWITEPDLGVISNGEISTLSVVAEDSLDRNLQYRLAPGSASKLPQGLSIQPSGNIVGKVSFNTFSLDRGATTFDKTTRSRSIEQETTFDSVFDFTVNAFSPDTAVISIIRRFRIRVIRQFDNPYQNLYIKAMPPVSDRDILNQLLQDQELLPSSVIYRADDLNFGVSTSVRYNHAFGLSVTEIENYVSAMSINHYWKNLSLGEISWAQAIDSSGNPVYEVVYSRVIDTALTLQNESGQRAILWPSKINGVRTIVYPNSLINMRDRMFEEIGRTRGVLPLWMVSKQPNGRVLGFIPSWVIAYVKPGEAAKVVYNIEKKFGDQLNQIDFKADRYEIDRTGTFAWDPINKQWLPAPPESTRFDQDTTVFNQRSVKFVTPAFTSTTTDEFDKYLLYPRTNILG